MIYGTNVTGIMTGVQEPLLFRRSPGIPLIIQDKTFVDRRHDRRPGSDLELGNGAGTVPVTTSTGTITILRSPKTGDLWWPHVYHAGAEPV